LERDISFFFPSELDAQAFAAEGRARGLRVEVNPPTTDPPYPDDQWSAWAYYPGLPQEQLDAEINALAEKHHGEWYGQGTYLGGGKPL